jgi:hypothetical protein
MPCAAVADRGIDGKSFLLRERAVGVAAVEGAAKEGEDAAAAGVLVRFKGDSGVDSSGFDEVACGSNGGLMGYST